MKFLKLALIFSFLILYLNSFAQSGKITGKVLDAKNAEPLIGVAVTIENTTRGGVTDLDGVFIIEGLTDGAYTVQASYVGYNTKKISEINVKRSEAVSVDINLEEASLQIEAVVVTAKRKQESVSTVLTIQRNSITVSDVLSGETMRRSPDRNVGDAIKRVSGVTIQDNKFPVIRGLNDRYNIAFVNGLPLPSTEPDRKAFSFDIFPSNIIDNIVVNKAATPDMPAEFAGGLIQLNTKDIPDDNFLQAQIGMALNTQTMGNDFLGNTTKSTTDWLGLDNSKRALPSNFQKILKLIFPQLNGLILVNNC
ncbi:MAG: TonB-dependent receptor plug domain-containing protein [Saprospiraceae bacterium]|nr:TonB-dependent receptor plug domain-containing protein [Saprospiraceae bacterium]